MTRLISAKRLTRLVVLLLVTAFVVSLASCAGQQKPAEQPKAAPAEEKPKAEQPKPEEKPKAQTQVSIGTASPGGHFYGMGAAMAELITKNVKGVTGISEQTGGSRENMGLLDSGKIDIGFATTEVGISAYEGKPPFTKKANIKYGFKLFNDTLTLVALKSSGIKKVADLKGKKISFGASGSSANVLGFKLLELHGISKDQVQAQYIGFDKAADALADRLIDAAFFMGATPIPAIQGLAVRHDVTVVASDKDKISQMGSPIEPILLKANTYKGQTEDVYIPGEPAGAWFRADMDTELVYQVVKAIFDNIDYMKSVDAISEQMEIPSKKVAEFLGVEVHPGVIKYAQEKGIW